MADYRTLTIKLITTNGKVAAHEIKLLKKALFVDGQLHEDELAFLADLRSELVKKTNKGQAKFDEFYLKCVQHTCLAAGAVGVQEMELIGKHVIDDPSIKPSVKKKFLDALKKKAGAIAPEFDDLYAQLKK